MFEPFIGVTIISLIPLFGLIAIYVKSAKLERYSHLLVSFAVGALLGNAVIHILPEVFTESSDPLQIGLAIIFGVLAFYSIEQFLRWRHCHKPSDNVHHHPVAIMNIVGDSVHNFIDGALITANFLVDPKLGWLTVIAVALHEIPQEIADFGVLLYAKWPIKKIILVNIFSALIALLGVIVGLWLNRYIETFSIYAAAVTAGGFIYIACTDLLPDLHEKGAETFIERLVQFLLILSGIAVFIII